MWPQQKNPKSLIFGGDFRVHFWALVFELHVLGVGHTCLKRDKVAWITFFPLLMWHYSRGGEGRGREGDFDLINNLDVGGGVIVHELHIKFAWYSKTKVWKKRGYHHLL